MAQILTANRLLDGAVVYWAGPGSWSEVLSGATLLPDAAEAATAERGANADIEARLVVGVYLMDASKDGGGVKPLRMREIIRAAGPSVRLDLGKQAELAR